MKKSLNFFSFLAIMILLSVSNQSFSQTPCSASLHAVFGDASTAKPVLLNRLGTSPQFGEIPKHTASSAYAHLNNIHKRNTRKSRIEIDNFLKALGYSGFKDPSFSASKITPEILPAGKTGWMGAYSRGHKYKWSVLGRDFETFKITSKDGSCTAYIMKKCGNAFYDPSVRCIPCTPCDPNFNDKVKCPPPTPAVVCVTQTINFVGNSAILAADVLNSTKSIPVVATFNGKNLCVGDFTVPVRLTYEMSATGEVNYAKTVQVCDYGSGVASNLNLNLPINLKYDLAASEVNIGEEGKMIMNINKKQYKVLKKVYSACPTNSAVAASNTTLAANKVNTSSEASAASTVSGTGNNKCVKQELKISGNSNIEDVSAKSNTQEVMIIGVYKKLGKLQKGETSEKYLSMCSYTVPAKSSLQYALKGSSNMDQIIEVCDTGNVPSVENISIPLTMKHSFTKQDVMIGDYGRIYTTLTKSEYKKLSRRFKRCCSDGSTGKCF